MNTNRSTALLQLVGALSFIWGSEWIAGRALSDLPRLEVFALRCFIGALALLPWAVRARTSFPAQLLRPNVLLGIALIAAPTALSSEATGISPGLAVLLFAMTPLVAGVIEGGLSNAALLFGGLLGIAFLVRGTLSFSATQGLSILWILLAVLCIAASMVYARSCLDRIHLVPSIVVQLVTAAIAISLYALVREARAFDWTLSGFDLVAILWMIALGIVASAIAYVVFYQALNRGKAGQVAVLQWLIPVVSFFETTFLFRHLPSWDTASGALLALVCAGLMLRAEETSGEDAALTLEITSPGGPPK